MKLKKALLIKGKICCESGLHIGGSSEEIEIGGLDMTVIKHPVTREPYIPGSSLKGKMRSSLERLKGINDRGEPCGCGQCLICRIFGPHKNTRHDLGPTRIIVRDAMLTPECSQQMRENLGKYGTSFLETKIENIINRAKGTAEHPRSLERVPQGTEFSMEIVLQVYDIDNEEEMLNEVKKSLLWVQKTYLGKGGSRGSGKVTFTDLTVDDKPFKLD